MGMHRTLWVGLIASVVVAAAGCGSKSNTDAGTGGVASGKPSEITGDLEVASFEGGYGIDFFEKVGKEFEAKHPGLKVKVWGSNRVWEQLQPRFVSGEVPDITWPGWGMDTWKLIYEDQLMDLNPALDGPGPDGTGKWRDSFDPKMLALGQNDGKQYLLPYHVNVMGWWFNPKLFAKSGWSAPNTYEELVDLCEKIKAAGIAPITFQGQYPYYMLEGMLIPWIVSAGGIDALDAMQQLKPGAWNSEAVIKAASMIAELRDKGYFQQGAIGLSHTQSQTEFLNNRAAMIPCGSWLHSEMREIIPSIQKKNPDAGEMEFMLPPVLGSGTGDPTALGIGIEPWCVPAKAKNPTAGVEYYKFMTAKDNAQKFVKEKGTLVTITGGNDVDLPPHLKGPSAALKSAKVVWMAQYRDWYKAFHEEVQNALTALINGETDPKGFADRCEAKAEETRKNPDIVKHTYTRS